MTITVGQRVANPESINALEKMETMRKLHECKNRPSNN
jgi:hypothetical protein